MERTIAKEINSIKDAQLRGLVKDGVAYEGLILKNVSEVATEKVRSDGKKQREFYSAYFGQGLFGKSFTRVMFQDHVGQVGNERTAWKNSPSPEAIAGAIGTDAGGVTGYRIDLTKPYTIDNGTRKTETTQFTFTLMPGENFETVLHSQMLSKGLVAPKTGTKNEVESSKLSTNPAK